MLRRFSVKGRMYLIILAIFALFLLVVFFAVQNGNRVKALGLAETGKIMYLDQKAKVKVASHALAVSVGSAIKNIDNPEEKNAVIRSLVNEIRYEDDKSGYFFVFDGTITVAMPPKQELVGKDLTDFKDKNGVYVIRSLKEQAKGGGGFVEYIWPKPGAGETPKVSYAEMIPGTNLWLGTGVYIDNIEAFKSSLEITMNNQVAENLRNMLISAGIVFGAIILLSLIIVFGLVKSLKTMIVGLKDIAEGEGDLTQRVNIDSNDEIGEMARWFNQFLEKMQTSIANIAGNTQLLGVEATNLSAVAEGLADNSRETSSRSDSVATASEEMSVSMATVAAAMEQSTTNTNMVASAAEEMTATIGEIATSAGEASEISEKAVSQAQVTSMRMSKLGASADAISKVTETITEISEQTNLLALNATIEAARAGEAGKGFAVVANEIKELAKQTADATLDIKEKIDDVQKTTGDSVHDIEEITGIINSVNDIVANISAAVGEQSHATQEIAQNIHQAAEGLAEVNENVSQMSVVATSITEDIALVSSASDEVSSTSGQVGTSSADLRKLTGELQQTVDSFKI